MPSFNQIMHFATDLNNILMVAAGLGAFATILTIGLPLLERDKLASRLKAVASRREELRAQHKANLEKSKKPQLRNKSGGFMKTIVDQLDLQRHFLNPDTKLKLVQAGYRGQAPLMTFLFFRLVMPFVLAGASAFYIFVLTDLELSQTMKLAICFGALIIGYYVPGLFVQNMITKRQESVMKAFPDALDLLLICVEAGMSIEASFNRVAREVGGASAELAEELGLTTAELSYLQDRRQAYENLGGRTGLAGVKAVCTSLIQAERYGTPLGTALRVMANENREMRMQSAEKKAAALPAKLTVPMIVFFLPVLFVVILGPAYIRYTLNS